MDVVYLISGLVLLVIGGEFLVRSAVALALKMRVSTLVIGMTVVSFATSAPELIVSINAALTGHPDITFGNVVGSNIANIGLVLGLTAALFGMPVSKNSYQIDWPMMMFTMALLYVFVGFDAKMGFFEGLLMVLILILFIYFLVRKSRRENGAAKVEVEDVDPSLKKTPITLTLFYLVGGVVALYFGSEFLIDGAVGLARRFDVSEKVISVTVVSIGTSVPELVASLMAAIRKEKDISIGNLIGSNVFNILAVLGITSMVTEIKVVDKSLLTNDFLWMVVIGFLVLPITFVFTRRYIGRIEGLFMFVLYILYVYMLF